MIFATSGIFIFLSFNQVNWSDYYYYPNVDSILTLTPFLNKPFLAGLSFAIGFGLICYLATRNKYESIVDSDAFKVVKVLVSIVFVVALYNLFRAEIGNYWHLQYVKTAYTEVYQLYNKPENRLVFDGNLSMFNAIWQINYTMLFLSILSIVNIKCLKNVSLGFALLTINVFVLGIFSSIRSVFLSANLRESYLLQTNAEHIRPWHFAYLDKVFFAGICIWIDPSELSAL